MRFRRGILAFAFVSLVGPVLALASGEPVITVPANMTVEAQNFSGATVAYAASAVDREGRAIPVICQQASGSIFPFGTTAVTCTAGDSEKSAVERFRITVVDSTAPALVLPLPKRVTTTTRSGAVVTYSATAKDVVDGPVPVTCSPASGAWFAVGLTNVSCSATDARHNASSATFDVTVAYKKSRSARNVAMLSPAPGATVAVAPMLRWRPAQKALFYNVQLFRRGHKVLSAWPARASLRLHSRWRYNGHGYSLKPGRYTWLVWPGYGRGADSYYGKLVGLSTFAVARPS